MIHPTTKLNYLQNAAGRTMPVWGLASPTTDTPKSRVLMVGPLVSWHHMMQGGNTRPEFKHSQSNERAREHRKMNLDNYVGQLLSSSVRI
jgi:hypothetical protein